MLIKEVPLNHTEAWKKHATLLQEGGTQEKVPPLRIAPRAAPAANAPRTTFAAGSVPPEWKPRIADASKRHMVSEALLAAVLRVESNFNPDAVSPKGAQGAMQIMPATGRGLGLKDVFDPEANLDAGARYLAMLLQEFSRTDLALAAYNAGPEAVRRHGGIPPYEETQNYVAKVLAFYNSFALGLR